uniref:Uncharacterized protein n=1 Tax=Equus caballus TaxID=9796 RepID=A0A3Q2KY93_HORSE
RAPGPPPAQRRPGDSGLARALRRQPRGCPVSAVQSGPPGNPSGCGSGRRSHSARPQPRGRGPGQPPHRCTRAPRLRAHALKPGQLALFGAQRERQGGLPVSRSLSSYCRHLRWRPSARDEETLRRPKQASPPLGAPPPDLRRHRLSASARARIQSYLILCATFIHLNF